MTLGLLNRDAARGHALLKAQRFRQQTQRSAQNGEPRLRDPAPLLLAPPDEVVLYRSASTAIGRDLKRWRLSARSTDRLGWASTQRRCARTLARWRGRCGWARFARAQPRQCRLVQGGEAIEGAEQSAQQNRHAPCCDVKCTPRIGALMPRCLAAAMPSQCNNGLAIAKPCAGAAELEATWLG